METARSLKGRRGSHTESLQLLSVGQSQPWPARFKGKGIEAVGGEVSCMHRNGKNCGQLYLQTTCWTIRSIGRTQKDQ